MTRRHQWPAVVFLLCNGPRTIPELMRLLDAGWDAMRHIVKLLEDEGLVKADKPKSPAAAKVYRWAN